MELSGQREFRVALADTWNDGKGGKPQKWVVFWGEGNPPILCSTPQEVAMALEAKATYCIDKRPT
jgi:hypothetical protein